ncbi:glutamic acid-rich protein-like isoform X2 [Carya illinoinensis]|uniref:glutamic acid-rich protein-like isoform X2 n=1 Tax=Carya illinoinensis TaxID=32201 RepID=UPI001C729C9F|nr:glutamic acid-rich protein-like isoform X2 [Carya illinoinensis]
MQYSRSSAYIPRFRRTNAEAPVFNNDSAVTRVGSRGSILLEDNHPVEKAANFETRKWIPQRVVRARGASPKGSFEDTISIETRPGGTITWDIYSKLHGRVQFGPTPTRQTSQQSIPTSEQEDCISKGEFDKIRDELIKLRNLMKTSMHAQASRKNQIDDEEEEKDEEEEDDEDEEEDEEEEDEEEDVEEEEDEYEEDEYEEEDEEYEEYEKDEEYEEEEEY